jgi:hypothetical protein
MADFEMLVIDDPAFARFDNPAVRVRTQAEVVRVDDEIAGPGHSVRLLYCFHE